MSVLDGIKPEAVFRYFEAICGIPHGSSDTKQLSDYCAGFAREHKLKYIQDSHNNIIIFKDGTPGYENSCPVILQGHLDMVCEKSQDCEIDFKTEALRLKVENGMISARGTTLGGDDGIAVAYGLALLESRDIPHPPLEVVFTSDEEIGMLGAAAIDCTELKSKIMLNLDSEEEGYLLVSCAGGVTAACHIPLDYMVDKSNEISKENAPGILLELRVGGLNGGHSGVEIDKGRANANQVLGRILFAIKEKMKFGLMEVNGGLKDNAIPREAAAKLMIADRNWDEFQELISEYNKILANEYRNTDKDIHLTVRQASCDMEHNMENTRIMSYECMFRVITALVNLPGGIQKMSHDIDGLVQTSLNMGILATRDDEVVLSFSVRSSLGSEKEELVAKLRCLTESLGGYVSCTGDYPAWEFRQNSELRKLMSEIYEEQTGRKPVIQALHAGVECGLFADKIPDLDCVSFGPDIKDIHTPAECMDIASVERTWNFLLEILKRLK